MVREEVIVVDSLIKCYGDGGKVGPISIRVQKGDVYGLVGPNGSGKTTTIRAVLGLLRPTSGRVGVMGMDPWKEPKKVNRILGYSAELPSFPPFLSAKEVLEFACKLKGMRGYELKKEIERVLDVTGLVNHADRKIGNYSKGMIQRLSVGLALAGDPEVLVLDEPMLGVDPVGRVQIREILSELAKTGKTMLFSSHDLYEVERLATRIGMVYLGRTVLEGEISEVLTSGRSNVRIRALTRYPPSGEVVDSIRNVKGVRDVITDGRSLTVIAEGSIEVRDAIAHILAVSGCGLLELVGERPSLEEVFVEKVRSVGNG